jgi:hypothetical protein
VTDWSARVRCRGIVFAALVAGLVAACASFYQGWVDPSLFPQRSSAAATGSHPPLVVLSDESLTQFVHVFKQWDEPDQPIPVGKIVDAAAMAAISNLLGPPVDRHTDAKKDIAVTNSVPGTLLLELRPVGLEVPVRGMRGLQARLVLDCRVLDNTRSPLWSKRYDSGGVGITTEQLNDSSATRLTQNVRATHAAAYAVMIQIAEDLRRWLEAERLRERVL